MKWIQLFMNETVDPSSNGPCHKRLLVPEVMNITCNIRPPALYACSSLANGVAFWSRDYCLCNLNGKKEAGLCFRRLFQCDFNVNMVAVRQYQYYYRKIPQQCLDKLLFYTDKTMVNHAVMNSALIWHKTNLLINLSLYFLFSRSLN